MGVENILAAPATTLMDGVSLGLCKGESVFSKEAEPVLVDDVGQNVGQVLLTKAPLASEKFTYRTTVYELSPSNLAKIMGDTLVNPTYITGGGTETATEHELIIYTMAPNGQTRKITIRKAVLTGAREYAMVRGEASAIALEFACVPDLSRSPGDQVYNVQDGGPAYSLTYGL